MESYYAAKRKGICNCGNKAAFSTKNRTLSSSCTCGEEFSLLIPIVKRYDEELEKAKLKLNDSAEAVLKLKLDFIFGYTKKQDDLSTLRDAYLKSKRECQDLSAKIEQLTAVPDHGRTLKVMKEATKEPLNCERFQLLQKMSVRSTVPFCIEDMEMIEKKTVSIQ